MHDKAIDIGLKKKRPIIPSVIGSVFQNITQLIALGKIIVIINSALFRLFVSHRYFHKSKKKNYLKFHCKKKKKSFVSETLKKMYTIYIYMCVDQAISSYNETVLLHLKDNKTSEKKYLRIDNDRDLKPLILAFF